MKTKYPVVWAQSTSDGRRGSSLVGYRLSAASTLVNHLATCDYQTVQVTQRANDDPSCTLAGAKTRRRQNFNVNPLPLSNQGQSQPPFAVFSNYPPQYTGTGFASTSSLAGPSSLRLQVFTGSGSELNPEFESMQVDDSNKLQLIFNSESCPPTPIMTPDFLRRNSLAREDSTLFPEDSASAIAGASTNSSVSAPSRQPHSNPPSSRIGAVTPRFSSGQLWSVSSQTEFENHIARITASANLPLSWVDNLEVVTFMDKYIPAATAPSRKVLTKRIIPKLVDELQNLW